jgi:uncharacterized damage-inducible protein DinB
MASVNEVAAKLTQQAADKLVTNLNAMPADKHQWKPLEQGRTAQHQILECVVINGMAAQILRDKAFPSMEGADWGQVFAKAAAENDTPEKLMASFTKATGDLIAATKAFPQASLDDSVMVPFDGSTRTWGEILFFPYWNMTYHEGQINYIQTLYGDTDMHW